VAYGGTYFVGGLYNWTTLKWVSVLFPGDKAAGV